MIKFLSLSSGSNGNCYYIGNEETALLIDAGIGPRTIKKRLAEKGLSLDKVQLVLVTHDHIDHVKSLGTLADRFHIPIYATHLLYNSMLNFRYVGPKIKGDVKFTEPGVCYSFKGIKFTPFIVPHDATQTVGYFIDFYGVKFTFLTDTGAITEEILKYGKMASALVIEANYDTGMLNSGPYPEHLRMRISQGYGHLSNLQSADAIRKIVSSNLTHIFLCHLSEQNNTPEIAYNTISDVLIGLGLKPGRDLTLYCLPRRTSSDLFTF